MTTLQLNYDAAEAIEGIISERRIFKLINDYLIATGPPYATQTAVAMIETAPSDIGAGFRWECSFVIPDMFYELSKQIPYSHPWQIKLARLFCCVNKLKKLVDNETMVGDHFCRNLGVFSDELSNRHFPVFAGDEELSDQLSKWLNYSAFLSRLMSFGWIDSATQAISVMKWTFEEPNSHSEVFDCLVTSAAVWILNAGQVIFAKTVQYPHATNPLQKPGEGVIVQPGELLENFSQEVYGLTRWEFWRKGFEAATEREASEESKVMARKAADLMLALQRTMTY